MQTEYALSKIFLCTVSVQFLSFKYFSPQTVISTTILYALQWIPWPEDHYTKSDGGKTDWTVFPFLHTFPATNTENSTWIGSTNELCEKTSALLKQVMWWYVWYWIWLDVFLLVYLIVCYYFYQPFFLLTSFILCLLR